MNLNLTGRHLEITPAIRQHVTDKIAKIKSHFDGVMDVTVVLSVDKLRQKAEGSVHLSGKDVFVESDDDNLYVAIDGMVEKLDRQIVKHKEKFAARRHDDSSRA
ncbi:MAG TPA: ribosome-associated translation inhibitor RaiA [Gallionellaceae bacterium]